jgi:putative DNA primase/helicase
MQTRQPTPENASPAPKTILPPRLDVIEAMLPELVILPQWIVWRAERNSKGDRLNKIPYVADKNSIAHASATDPATWRTFQQAAAVYKSGHFHGVSFAFTAADSYFGFDIDHCVQGDPNLFEWQMLDKQTALDVMRLNTYTELSPSGTGLKGIGIGELPLDPARIDVSTGKIRGGRKLGCHEMYTGERFFTVTGWHVTGCPTALRSVQDDLDKVYWSWFPAPATANTSPLANKAYKPAQAQSGATSLSDSDVIARATAARNGARFSALMAGDASAYDGDHSRADLALCSWLAWWTDDAGQIARIVSQSALNRAKWDRDDYRETTIQKAMQGVGPRRRLINRIEDTIDEDIPEAYEPPIELQTLQTETAEYTSSDEQAASLIARLQAALAKLQEEVETLRLENRILRNPDLRPAAAKTLISVAKELDAQAKRGAADDNGFVKLPLWKIAEQAGVSTASVGKIVDKGVDAGIIQRESVRGHNPKDPLKYTVDTYIRPTQPLDQMLETLADYKEPTATKKQWGGSRPRCPKHPDAKVIPVVWKCSECGELIHEEAEYYEGD